MAIVPTLPQRWSPPTTQVPQQEERGDFGLSFEIGQKQLHTVPAWFQGAGASLFEKAGFDDLALDWRDKSRNTIKEMSYDVADLEAQYKGPHTFKEAQELGSPGAYALWGINAIANQAPILAVQAMGALAGAAVGAAAGALTGGPAGVIPGLGFGGRAGWRVGATAGTLATSALLNTGEIYSSALIESGESKPGVTAFAGLIAGSLDAVNPGRFLMFKGHGRSFGVWFGRKLGTDNAVAKGFLSAMEYAAVEGFTERLQNHIENNAVNYIKGEGLFAEYTEWQREELTESAATGGLLGAVLGWIPGVMSGRITTPPVAGPATDLPNPLEEVPGPPTPPRRPGFRSTEGATVTELAEGLWPIDRREADPEGFERFKRAYADSLSTEAADVLAGTRTVTEPKPGRAVPTFGVTEIGLEDAAREAARTVTPVGDVPGEARRSQSKNQVQADFDYRILHRKSVALEARRRAGEDVADELNGVLMKLDMADLASARLDREERGGEGLGLSKRTVTEIQDSIDAWRREPVVPDVPKEPSLLIRKPEYYAIRKDINRRLAALKKARVRANDKWNDLENPTIEDYAKIVGPADLELNLAIMADFEHSFGVDNKSPDGHPEYEDAKRKVARALEENPALEERGLEAKAELTALVTGVTKPRPTFRQVRGRGETPTEAAERKGAGEDAPGPTRESKVTTKYTTVEKPETRTGADTLVGVRKLSKKEVAVEEAAQKEEARVAKSKRTLARAMAKIDKKYIKQKELWAIIKGAGVTFKDLNLKSLPSKDNLFLAAKNYIGEELWSEHVLIKGLPPWIRNRKELDRQREFQEAADRKPPKPISKKRQEEIRKNWRQKYQDWKDKTLYRDYLTAVLEDAKEKLSRAEADARLIRSFFETPDGKWIPFVELNKDYIGYVASQVSPPIPVETTRYFVEEEASPDVKARQERQRREGKEVERVGYWATGPKYPLKTKSVYDELKKRSDKYIVTDEEIANIRDNIIPIEALVEVTARVGGRLEERKLAGETLGLPGELKVTVGKYGPEKVEAGEVGYKDETLVITDSSEYKDYAADIDEDQMWHGDAESNYLTKKTAQESVNEFIDNQLKRKLELFLQARVDPAHPTKKDSRGRVKVWVLPKAEFESRFPSKATQLDAIGAKKGKGVDWYGSPRLTFVDEETTKKYTKELLPQYKKLTQEPDWVIRVKREILERRKSKGLRNPGESTKIDEETGKPKKLKPETIEREKKNFYVSKSGNYTIYDPTTKLLVAYDSNDIEFSQQFHNETVKNSVRERLDFLKTKFKGIKNIPMWTLQMVSMEFNIKTGLNVEVKGTPFGKKDTLHLDNVTMDEMISALEIPDPRVFTPTETPEGAEALEEAYIAKMDEDIPSPNFFINKTDVRNTGVTTNYQRASAKIGTVVDLTVRKGDAPLLNVKGKIINWVPAQYSAVNDMSAKQIEAANKNGLQKVELLDTARLPEVKKGKRSARIEEGKAFRAEIGPRDKDLPYEGFGWDRDLGSKKTLTREERGEIQKGLFAFRTYYKTSPEMIEVVTSGGRKYRFDKDNIVYMSPRSAETFNPKSDRVIPPVEKIYEHIRKNSIQRDESAGDFLARISEPKYTEDDVYIPGTAAGTEEIFVGTKVYKVIKGETHYNKVYTVSEVSATGRVRLESELGVTRRLLPDIDVVVPEEDFTKTGKLRKRTIKRKGEVEDVDYGWFTRGEVAVFNPSQVEIARQRPPRAEILTGPSTEAKIEWLEKKFGTQRPLLKTVSIKEVGLGNAVKLQVRAFKRSLARGIPQWTLKKDADVLLLVPDYKFIDQKVSPKTFRISGVGTRYITLHDVALGQDVLKVSANLLAGKSLNSQASIDAVEAEIDARNAEQPMGAALIRGQADFQATLDESPWMFVEEEKFKVTDADRRVPKGDLVGGERRAGQYQSAPTARWTNAYGVVINEIYIDDPGKSYTSDGTEVNRIPVYQIYNPWGVDQLEMHSERLTLEEAMKAYGNKKFYEGMNPGNWHVAQLQKKREADGIPTPEGMRGTRKLPELAPYGQQVITDTHADLPFDKLQEALKRNRQMFGPLIAELEAWSQLMEKYPNLGKRNKYGEVFIPVALRREMADHGYKNLRELFEDLKNTVAKEYNDATTIAYSSVKKDEINFSVEADSIVSEDGSIVILDRDQVKKRGITPDELSGILVEAFGEGIRNILHIVRYQQELPVKFHRAARIRGVSHNNEVWLVSDNLPRQYVVPVVTHEIGAHGMQAIIGKKAYGQLLDIVGKMSATDPAMKHAMDEARKALKKTTPDASEALVLEETFGYYVEHNTPENTSFWRTLLDHIVAGFARLKLMVMPNLVTATDLIALAKTAVRMHTKHAENSKDSVYVANWLNQPLYMASESDWHRAIDTDPVVEAVTGSKFFPDWMREALGTSGLGNILKVDWYPNTREIRKGKKFTVWVPGKGRVGFGIGPTMEKWIIDVDTPIHKLVNVLEERFGVKISIKANPSERAAALRMKNVYDIDQLQKNYIKPMWDFLKSVGVKGRAKIEDFHWYLYLTHAPYRNATFFKRSPKKGKYQSGLAGRMINGVLVDDVPLNPDGTRNEEIPLISEKWKELEARLQIIEDKGGPTVAQQMENFAKAATYVYAINNFRLSHMLEWGLIDQATINKWTKDPNFSKTYVPLRGEAIGFIDELFGEPLSVAELNVAGPESKRAVGRKSPAQNVIAWSVLQAQNTIKRANKNQVVATMARLVHELQYVVDPITGAKQRAFVDEMVVVKRDDFKEGKGIDPETGEPFLGLYPKYFQDPDHVATFKENGEEWMILMKEKQIGQALNRSAFDTAGQTMRGLAYTTRIMGALRTAWDLAFIPTNFTRDLATAIFNIEGFRETTKGTRLDLSDMSSKQIVKDIPKAMKGLWLNIRGETQEERTSTEFARLAELAASVGGRIDFAGWKNVQDFEKTMQKVLSDGTRDGFRKYADALGTYVSDMNSIVENATRLAAFKQVREQYIKNGMSESEATTRAGRVYRELTVDFSKRGEKTMAWNSLYLFFRAGVLGSARVISTLGRSRRVRNLMKGVFLMGFTQSMLNYFAAGDDEDGRNRWLQIRLNQKSRYMYVYVPGLDYFQKVPLPYGFGVFYVYGDAFATMLLGGATFPQVAGHMVSSTMESYMPISLGNSDSFIKSTLKTATPTLASPLIELGLNENWMGNPIYREPYPNGRVDPPSERYWNSTGPTAKWISKWVNKMTGGTEFKEGMVSVEPDILEHLWEFATGGLGRFVRGTLDTGVALVGPGKMTHWETGDIDWRKIPVLYRYFHDETVTRRWDIRTKDMEYGRAIDTAVDIRDSIKTKYGVSSEEYIGYAKSEDFELAKLQKTWRRKEAREADLYKRIAGIDRSRLMSNKAKEEKTRQLREQIRLGRVKFIKFFEGRI
jgi:hypothetical protein